MSKPFLSIGMSTFDDAEGVYWTTMVHRLLQDTTDCEFIIIDNNPDSKRGGMTKDFIQSIAHTDRVRYVPYTEIGGTAQPRNHIVDIAEGEFVLISDPHVMVQANGIHRLKDFLRNADEEMRKNLFTGPLLYDGLKFIATHFDCGKFQDQMLGTWATAWRHPDGTLVITKNVEGKVGIQKLADTVALFHDAPVALTDISWPGHEQQLMNRGYKVHGMASDDAPFEIPGQGFGLFVTSKKHWIPFNRDYRKFGGEECVHHELYRQKGRKTLCLPFLKWVHRFMREAVPYPLDMESKIRNYVLGFDSLGYDREPIRKHFVDEVKVPQATYDAIAADPVNFVPFVPQSSTHNQPHISASSVSNLGHPLPTAYQSLGDIIEFLLKNPRDLNEHINDFMQYTAGFNTAVELTKRRESTAFLLGAMGRRFCDCDRDSCKGPCVKGNGVLISYQEENDTLIAMCQEMVKTHTGRPLEFAVSAWNHDQMVQEIPETDILFIDTRHTGERLLEELTAYAPKVKGRILMHDTAIYGLVGEGNSKGLLWAIREFVTANPEWFIASHKDHQYGFTVLSRLPIDRPKEKIVPWPKITKDGQPCGPGQELKAILAKFGITSTDSCPCNARAKVMNEKGPDWCRENIEEILDWLKEQADSRNMGSLFVRPVVKLMVQRAISKAEKAIKNGDCY